MQEIQNTFPTTKLAETSADPFPILDNIWSLFARKGNKTVFVTVGASKTSIPDLELAETLGCPLHVVPVGSEQEAKWAEVGATLKARARPAEEMWPTFSAGAEEKWILPKNFRLQSAMPWWSTGTLDLSGEEKPIKTRAFFPFAADICQPMGFQANVGPRIDILKVDVPDELERGILMSMLEHNLRPAVLMVKWTHMPDTHIPTSITAGHLQNSGYMLLSTIDNKFLYFFVDQDIYMSCSWEDTTVANPFLKHIISVVQKSKKNLEGESENAAQQPPSQTETIPSGGEAVPESSGEASTNRS
jgi:hypothetical protein